MQEQPYLLTDRHVQNPRLLREFVPAYFERDDVVSRQHRSACGPAAATSASAAAKSTEALRRHPVDSSLLRARQSTDNLTRQVCDSNRDRLRRILMQVVVDDQPVWLIRSSREAIAVEPVVTLRALTANRLGVSR